MFLNAMAYIDFTWITTLLVFLVTFLAVWYNTKRPGGMPPGPALYPIIGNLPSFTGNVLENLAALRNRYGDIYSLYIGKEPMIFLNGYDVIHDALIKRGSQFVRRPCSAFHNLVVQYPGIIFSNGVLWKEQRSFTQKALQELCFKNGSKNVEVLVMNEVRKLLNAVELNKCSFDIEHYVNIGVTNVVFRVICNHAFDYDDEIIHMILAEIREGANNYMFYQTLTNCFPFLHKLPFDVLYVEHQNDRYRKIVSKTHVYTDKVKEAHDQGVTDTAVDMYLNRIAESKEEGRLDTFTEQQMEQTLYDLMVAGSETTASTIRWILLYLIRRPDIQEKMYKEINTVLGTDEPCLADRKRLPYTQAVIHEGLRIAAVAPLSVPHSVDKDTEFHGYMLPKDCTIMINIDSSNNDPNVWSDPETFKPERYLNEDETDVIIPKELISFSLGPRSCLGETLSRIELFLFLTSLVQTYKFLAATDDEVPPIAGTLGITWCPNPFKMRALKRKS